MAARRAASIVAAALLCMTAVGCSGPAASAAGSAAAGSAAASSPPACTAALALRQARAMLAGQESEVHYLTIADKLTLSIWLVDPEIDLATPAAGIPAAGRGARERGLSIVYRAIDEVPCVRRVFDQVNPMIVDRRYRHWYKDFLPVRAFVGLRAPTPDDIVAALEGAGTAPEEPRTTAPEASATQAPGSCTWADARSALRGDLGGEENTAAYLIVGAGLVPRDQAADSAEDVGVEVQWPVHGAAEAADTRIRERLGYIARRLACMSPSVDSLEAFVVDDTGRTLVYAVTTGPVIQGGNVPLPAGGVHIYRTPAPAKP